MTEKITEDVFKMQMDSLAVYLKQSLSPKMLNEIYWPFLKQYNKKRFAECIKWLEENYDNTYRFPLISDFKKGFSATNKVKYYDQKPEAINREEYSKDILALAKKFSIPGHRSQKQKKLEKRAEGQEALYERMKAENKVFSRKLGKWVHKTLVGNIGGEFLYPGDKL